MSSAFPQIGPNWQVLAVRISVPTRETGWITDIEFMTPEGPRTTRFSTSVDHIPIHDFIHGFDSVRITNQNAGGANCLEYGKYLVEVFIDDECTRFVADNIVEVSDTSAAGS